MAENVYEGMFILESGRYSRDPGGVSDKIAEVIKSFGGEMLVSRLWEERRLAYPIRGYRKGTYWLSYFRVEGTKIGEIERQFQLTDSVLRSMFVKVDSRIVEALVEHAKAGGHSSKPSKTDKPVEATTVDESAKSDENAEAEKTPEPEQASEETVETDSAPTG